MKELLLDDVVIRWISVSSMNNNVYLVTERASGKQLLVDAADDFSAIVELIDAAGTDGPDPRLVGIATTHQHWDHVRALAEAAKNYPVPTYAGVDDAQGISREASVRISNELAHGDVISLGDVTIEAIHLRGHTPGSIAYVIRDSSGQNVILSGDSLFPGGVGNTGSSPQRFTSLLDDVIERIFDRFGDDTLVYPGHGDATTLGAERGSLDEWRARGW
ncbi:MBL fold metallo-hydrolase [Glutamicibacter sp.]|uniref:MBL fold metallo-hydrolase n=1 Tax=Glutamicibacter sp. TaxID=1931995 RepID=UPI0028BD6C7C|nr:MBL fold metallo-hydrolase [Glutamicibacter sp.]